MTSWSTCAASRRRRNRLSLAHGASASRESTRLSGNKCPGDALGFLAEAASAPLRPPTGCVNGGWPTWRSWLWASPPGGDNDPAHYRQERSQSHRAAGDRGEGALRQERNVRRPAHSIEDDQRRTRPMLGSFAPAPRATRVRP